MPWGRVGGIAAVTIAILWLMLDSAWFAEPAERVMSASLAGLGALFGAGSAVMWFGGRPERSPQYAGLSIGLLVYAVARLWIVQ